jgi:hypothetical protein
MARLPTPPVATPDGGVGTPPVAPQASAPTAPAPRNPDTVHVDVPATVDHPLGAEVDPPVGTVEIVHADGSQEIGGYRLVEGANITLAKFGEKGVQISSTGSGGGGGTPAPPNGSIQFDNAGAFGGFGKYDSGQSSTSFDISSVAAGVQSVAGGMNCNASGNQSVAIGSFSLAIGAQSVAGGSNCNASGDQSVAFGDTSLAAGQCSVAMGFHAHATGDESVAIGFEPDARAQWCIAIGASATSGAQGAVCVGSLASFAESAVAVAVGDGLDSVGIGSVTMSEDNSAHGDHGYAFGELCTTLHYGEYGFASQGGNTGGHGAHLVQVQNTLAAAPGVLNLGTGAELNLENNTCYSMKITVLGSRATTNGISKTVIELTLHTSAGNFVLDDQVVTYQYNPNVWGVTVTVGAGFGDYAVHITCDPGADTVQFVGTVEWTALPGASA